MCWMLVLSVNLLLVMTCWCCVFCFVLLLIFDDVCLFFVILYMIYESDVVVTDWFYSDCLWYCGDILLFELWFAVFGFTWCFIKDLAFWYYCTIFCCVIWLHCDTFVICHRCLLMDLHVWILLMSYIFVFNLLMTLEMLGSWLKCFYASVCVYFVLLCVILWMLFLCRMYLFWWSLFDCLMLFDILNILLVVMCVYAPCFYLICCCFCCMTDLLCAVCVWCGIILVWLCFCCM